ncbi:GTP cyclohydrolase II [Portibacter marinus]|uniref:GTP cyclohydrolase II n=1 Tax=Portibacter marinus TaxID=2898660 RepID=UPI001F006A4D|nr:GTP cyclohydrolase II [Portibacter marinus]
MKKQSEAMIPTPYGNFRMIAYADSDENKMPHVVMVSEKLNNHERVVLRIHSECLTGDLFGSKRCDCGEQLERSLQIIGREKGILIYLRQEGRGIGLINKLKAYQLQDQGMNTIDANIHLGFEPDERDYEEAGRILKDLDIKAVRLLTNNPEKVDGLNDYGIEVTERIPIIIDPSVENEAYLKIKSDLMGHILEE